MRSIDAKVCCGKDTVYLAATHLFDGVRDVDGEQNGLVFHVLFWIRKFISIEKNFERLLHGGITGFVTQPIQVDFVAFLEHAILVLHLHQNNWTAVLVEEAFQFGHQLSVPLAHLVQIVGIAGAQLNVGIF